MLKIADSAAIRHHMPTRPRHSCESGNSPGVSAMDKGADIVSPRYSYFQSGSSGCFRSQSGRRLATLGIVAKLYAGGGELTDHSSVQPSHGSLPALAPFQYETIRFATNTRIAMP